MIRAPTVAEAPPALPTGGRRAGPRRHILMVAPTSFFADYGCHVRIYEEAQVLRRLGQRVTIVTYYNGRDVGGLDIRRSLPIPWRRDYEVGSSRHKIGLDALLGLKTLAVARALRPDLVHGHLHEGALVGALAARLLGRPLVFDYQGSLSAEMADHGFLDPAGPFHRPVRALERRIDRLAAAIVTSSRHAAGQLAGDFGVDPGRIHTLPDCVETGRFRPGLLSAPERARGLAALGVPPGRRVVVYLGLLARHQGTDLLLEAAHIVVGARPDTHFLVMGFPGVEGYAARAAALGLGGHVTFTGRVPYDEAATRLALGDVAVAPKISVTEGSGKLLNYMALGLPTVAFDTPVSREYLGREGRYAPAGDAPGLAAALCGLLDDPDGAAALGRALRARAVARYDWRHAGEALVALYDRVAPLPAERARAGSG